MKTFSIGRDAGNQIVLNDNFVSRRHAELIISDNGQVMIRDLGSKNGTFVNGKRIADSYITTGDTIKCANVIIEWEKYIISISESKNAKSENRNISKNYKPTFKKRDVLLLTILVLIVIFAYLFITKTDKTPQKAKDTVFASVEFSKPIYLSVPFADNRNAYENIVNSPVEYDYGLIPPVTLYVENNKPIKDFSPSLLTFLTQNEYLEIKEAVKTNIDRFGANHKTFYFALYTPKSQPYLTKYSNTDWEYGMKAGIRKFKSITFENSYKQTIFEVETLVYSLKFNYTIEPLLPELKGISNLIYTGEAQIYKDKKDAVWKILDLNLTDDSERELLKIIETLIH